MPAFTLHTLGALYVREPTGEPARGAAAQRRVLALLALLAVAGDAGLSRDRLVALLWPEADTERGRHSLTQALYAARRALRADDLFVTGADVRVNPERLSADVVELDAALAAGDLERAVALYEGPFLDGFYLTGSAEFEQWVTAQRERIEARVVAALDSLASAAESASDHARAVECRRRLAALRPLDASVAAKLMTALARAGDRAGALQHARVHEALLRDQLDLDPDPVVTALATRLREPMAWSPDTMPDAAMPGSSAAGAPSPPRATPDEVAPPEAEAGDGVAAAAPLPHATVDAWDVVREPTAHRAAHARPATGGQVGVWVPSSPTRIWWARASALVVVLVLVLLGIAIGRGSRDDPPALGELPIRQRVVVAPFRAAGADASLGYLRDGMVELLSTRLADDTAARSVDAGAVLGAWRAAGLSTAMDVPRDTIVKLAARLGAERVVVGSVVGSPARIILRAAVLAVPSGAAGAEASVSGPVDSLTTLIDRLAGQLLAAEAGEDTQLGIQTTRSLPALRAFLAGQAALRASDYTAALRHYESALRRDSTFALAALRAVTVADHLLDAEQLRRSLAVAWTHRAALNELDERVLLAYAGPRYPAPSTAAELRAAWQRVFDVAPRSADTWFSLGMRIMHDGAAAALPAPRARAAEAFQRALAAGPYPPARGFLTLLGAVPLDTGAASPATLGPFAPFARWHAAVARADGGALARLRDTLYLLGPANLRAIAMASQYDAMGLDDGARAIEQLAARATRASERADALLAQHALALNRGRPREALAVTLRLQRAQPGTHAALRLRVLDALYADGDSTAAAAAARELAALTGPDPSATLTTRESWRADVCTLGEWSAARGDSAAVRRAAALLRASAASDACAMLLDAAHAVLVRGRGAAALVQGLDSLVFAPQVVGDVEAYAPLRVARLHERLGDPRRALAALRRRTYMTSWPRYLATVHRDEARLAERTGDFAGMRAAYARYVALRDAREDEAAPELAGVRRRLGRATEGEPRR